MARDIARGPGTAILILAILAMLLETSFTRTFTVNGVTTSETGLLGVQRIGTIFVLLATAGIVSSDFAGGYHRVLFVKPVAPPLYYLLRWGLGGVAVGLGILLLEAGVAVRLDVPMQSLTVLAQAGLTYLLLGGLVLCLSTVTRRDWLMAVLLMIGHYAIEQARAVGFWSGPVVEAAYSVLPPFHLIGFGQPVAEGWALAHVILYGAGLVLAALAVLRWRPLGAGRRE